MLGFLLDRLLQRAQARGGPYRTFFTNSGVEAVGAAIKLCRHSSVRHRRANDGRVLIVDPEQDLRVFFDPTEQGSSQSLAPGLCFVESLDVAADRLAEKAWSGVIVARSEWEARPRLHDAFADAGHESGALLVLSNLGRDLGGTYFSQSGIQADAHIFGEDLSARQLPFGCLTMSQRAHSVWNNIKDAAAHTTTFGGAAVSLRAVLEALDAADLIEAEDEIVLKRIEGTMTARVRAFHHYVNPPMARLNDAMGMALDIKSALGSRLVLSDGREIIDSGGGSGSNLRGHNPPDLVENVLTAHRPDGRYYDQLESVLQVLTGYPHSVPAVSGGTAVDLAVSFAMLAQPDRKTIVSFRGNYSGKTPISLSLSKHGTLLTESDREAFRPYYANLEYIDLDEPGCESRLETVLNRPDVALVWLELIQGAECRPIPDSIIELVHRCKAPGGYLVGIDEVLTGGWRIGGDFLVHRRLALNVDVSAMAKPLSDMTVPLGVALVTDDVYRRAAARNPKLVEKLTRHYRCELSAHIALNALSGCADPERIVTATRLQEMFAEGLRRIFAQSRIFAAVSGEGGLVRLTLSRRWFPFHRRSALGCALEMALAELVLSNCGVFVPILRFHQRIFADEAELREVLNRLERGTRQMRPVHVYVNAVRGLLTYARRARYFRSAVDWATE
ncbi:aminotransferase class III-fold pyridoxal phosphate-dependent enzyme [Protofrankia coriariae]|uniref:aminotransferase class III-fold pyridoxal phosphate-dependent enzyme n=1 Tax=Protofrankia coriariae TaxID=1562887 RepID=UPI0012F6D7B5|nr:aminotransferase class III-fold pyridoxal phosphate-dependent enzyme [Protofrankia coriariae]